MENISEIDYAHVNNVFKKFNINNLGECHDLCVRSDTLLLADIFENFRQSCLENYELDPAHFVSLPGLAWQACLKKTNVELELLTDYDFEKDFFKLMNNAVFGKTMGNVRKHRDIKLVKSDKKRNKLVSEPNFHTMKLIDNNLAIIGMKKVKVKMNKPIYLGLSILDISKITMYEFWYDYVKIKYEDKAQLCYMDTDSFVVNIKTKDFYKDISQDVNKRFDTSNYTFDRPLPTGINKKVIGLMKDELGGDIITEFVALRPKAYSYVTNNFIEMKKAKGTKKCIVNKMLRFNDYKKCLLDNGKSAKVTTKV